MPEWTFKENAKPQGSSDGFWYDLTKGGYINPEDVLDDVAQLVKLQDAIRTLASFENAMRGADLLNEF